MPQDPALFADFPHTSKDQWIAQAQHDLGKEPFAKLVTQTGEGFEIQPFYTAEDMLDKSWLHAFGRAAVRPDNALSARQFLNLPLIEVSDPRQANAEALHALNEGADGILFDLGKETAPSLEVLLAGIKPEYCSIGFRSEVLEGAYFTALYTQYLHQQGTAPERLHGFLAVPSPSVWESQATVPGFRTAMVGAGDASVTVRIAHLLEQWCQVAARTDRSAAALAGIGLSVTTSNQYFMEIAGLRALRLLVTAIARQYGAALEPWQIFVHAVTRIQVTDREQQHPDWNLLSNTTQAMSAILGGADALTVLPHTAGEGLPAAAFAPRIARNVASMLREESYLDRYADPVAGSYYLENLTEQIARQAWEVFCGRSSATA